MAVDGYSTLRQVVYDLLNDFNQLHADASITPFQMTFWVLTHADRLKKQHIAKLDSGAYVAIFDVTVRVADRKKYFTLPGNIYDYNRDAGIEYVTYPPEIDLDYPALASIRFGRTRLADVTRLYYRKEERPAADNPYFYRVGDRVYTLGTEKLDVQKLETGLYLTLDPNNIDMNIDQPFDFPQDLLPLLKRQVLELGMWALNVPKNLINDSRHAGGDVPNKKLLSVNDDVNNEEQ